MRTPRTYARLRFLAAAVCTVLAACSLAGCTAASVVDSAAIGSSVGDSAAQADGAGGAPTELTVLPASVSSSGFTVVWGKPDGYASVEDYQVSLSYSGATATYAASSDRTAATDPVAGFYAQRTGDLAVDGSTAESAQAVSSHCFHVTGLAPSSDCTVEVRAIRTDGSLSDAVSIEQATAAASTELNIGDFGAVADGACADGTTGAPSSGTLNTAAIQSAIDACPAQGTVLIPARGIYVTGPIALHADMTLDVEGTLLGTADASCYANPFDGDSHATGQKSASLVTCSGSSHASSIRIVGSGVIDGNGWCAAAPGDEDGFPRYAKGDAESVQTAAANHLAAAQCARYADQGLQKAYATRSNLLSLSNVDGLYLGGGLTLRNPSMHTVSLSGCSDATIDSLRIATYDCNNGDGVDWSNSEGGLTVVGCVFDTGDDSLCFSAASAPAGNAWVFDNCFLHGHGAIALGSDTAYGIDNVLVEDDIFDGCGSVLCGKAKPGGGGGAWNILLRDSAAAQVTDGVGIPFFLTDTYGNQDMGGAQPCFHDIRIERCTVNGARNAFVSLRGAAGSEDRNIVMKDVAYAVDKSSASSKGNASDLAYLDSCVFDGVSFYGIDQPWNVSSDDGQTIENVQFRNGTPAP